MCRLLPLLLAAGCASHPWVPMLEAMRAERVLIEISTDSQDFNKQAPPSVAPSKENKWLLFFYDPARDPAMHESFATRLSDDCFFAEVVKAVEADEPGAKPSHAAICAFERVPPVPAEESQQGTAASG